MAAQEPALAGLERLLPGHTQQRAADQLLVELLELVVHDLRDDELGHVVMFSITTRMPCPGYVGNETNACRWSVSRDEDMTPAARP